MASSSGVQRRAVTATSRLDRRRPQVMARPAAVAPITSPREETASCAAWRAIRICFERMLTAHVRETSRSEEHTSELQSRLHLVCRLLLEKKKKKIIQRIV